MEVSSMRNLPNCEVVSTREQLGREGSRAFELATNLPDRLSVQGTP
jgi:hypothetical protein